MAKSRILIAFALPAILACAHWPGEQQKEPSPKSPLADTEIKQLIKELGALEYKIREKATKRLAEIGVPALGALMEAQQNDDLETRQRAKRLLSSIRSPGCCPTLVNGVQFELVADKEWVIPEPGIRTPISICLTTTNTADHSYSFTGIVKLLLTDSTGQVLPIRRLGSVMSVALNSPRLEKGQSFTNVLNVTTVFADGKLDLRFEDVRTYVWLCAGIPSGTYRLAVIYEIPRDVLHEGTEVWTGRVEMSETVVVK